MMTIKDHKERLIYNTTSTAVRGTREQSGRHGNGGIEQAAEKPVKIVILRKPPRLSWVR
jgi:hypothetical protein